MSKSVESIIFFPLNFCSFKLDWTNELGLGKLMELVKLGKLDKLVKFGKLDKLVVIPKLKFVFEFEFDI